MENKALANSMPTMLRPKCPPMDIYNQEMFKAWWMDLLNMVHYRSEYLLRETLDIICEFLFLLRVITKIVIATRNYTIFILHIIIYRSGIYNDPSCDNQGIDHAVVIVGYATDSATKLDYWIVRNSWGTGWGQAGYIYIQRGVNKCKIEEEISYVVAGM